MAEKQKVKMMFDFLAVPIGQEVSSFYPELEYYKEFTKTPPGFKLRQVCIYVSNLIDKDSPIANIRDYHKRAEKALELAGYAKSIKGWSPALKDVMDNKNMWVNLIIAKYFELMSSYDYESWMTKKISFHQIAAEMRKPLTPGEDVLRDIEKKNKISIQLDQIKSDLMKIEDRLFDDGRLRRLIIDESAKNRDHYAEEYALTNEIS